MSSRSQSLTGGSSEGTGVIPGVPNDSTVILATSSEGTGIKPGVPDEQKVTSKANVILKWGSKQETEYTEEDDDDEKIEWVDTDEEEEKNDDDDDKSIDLEKMDDEETDDEFMPSEEHVQDDDEETDDKFVHGDEQVNDDKNEEMTNADTGNGDEEIIDAAKADIEKTKEAKDDIKDADFPPLSSNLSVSLGLGNQFLNLSSDKSTVKNLKDSVDVEINSLLDVQIQQKIPQIQSPSILIVPMISEPLVLTPIPETPSVAPAITLLPPPSVSTIPPALLQSTTQISTPLITTEAPPVTTILDLLHAIFQRVYVLLMHILDPVWEMHFISTIKNALEKTPLLLAQSSSQAPSSLKITESLSEYEMKKVLRKRYRDDEDPSARPNQGKKTKRSRTKESEPSNKSSTFKESSKGKSPAKTSKSVKSVTIEEPVEMASDDIPWFNKMVIAIKDPLTFDELIATLIDFSNIELKYNMEECFKALIEKLDWNNPERDHCPFNLNNPLPLKCRLGYLTVAAEYFFNNDLEFIKSSDLEKKYTTSITKTKAARYEIVGGLYALECYEKGDFVDLHLNEIEDMLLLVVQHKLFQLDRSDIVEFIVAISVDKISSGLMVELIDKQMLERRIIRNLERLVGAQELEMDYRLMTRTK
ncbi:hypothetical protein Tco_0377208 [Tanacetum coccineum]